MSFRIRLILAFVLFAALQAALFSALSDQLLRDGLEGEANARLSLLGSLFPGRAPRPWPPAKLGGEAGRRLVAALKDFASAYRLDRATLLLEGQALDSGDGGGRVSQAEEWWLGDGLAPPLAHGSITVSGPLYKSEQGWRKTLYLKLDPGRQLWLRLEAGTPFLGSVSTLQKRMRNLAIALGIPALVLGLLLGYGLSRRARALSERLAAGSDVRLQGRDEFASISHAVAGLLERLEAQRSANERLALSRLRQARDLALGVAHELRNPLAGLSLSVDLLSRKRAAGAPEAELASISQRLQDEVGRLEATVARFLDFARTPELKSAPLDLAAAAVAAAKGVVPAPQFSGEATAKADPQALAVVAGVLLNNASESAGSTGWVRAEAGEAGGRAWLKVSDSGPPVPDRDRERLFTPFFSTKPKGLGLGLATAASLADAMDGKLRLLEDGKTFELSLPSS